MSLRRGSSLLSDSMDRVPVSVASPRERGKNARPATSDQRRSGSGNSLDGAVPIYGRILLV